MEALLAGLVLGLGSGVAPGPLLALAITTTLRRGWQAGLQVAVAPLVSDALVIAITLTLVAQLPGTATAALALAGGAVIALFGVESLRAARTATVDDLRARPLDGPDGRRARTIRAPWALAALVNLTNPAPWLFWATVGAPALVGYWHRSPGLAVAFLLGFYPAIVGSKALIVLGLAAGRHRLSTAGYRAILAGAGLALLAFAVLFVVDAVRALTG